MDRLGPYLLGPNDTPECGIYTGDAKVLSKTIPDKSVDLIFTDPVYQNIDDYRWLAETAATVLKSDRACLVFSGQAYKAKVLEVIRNTKGLKYRWDFALTFIGRGATYWHGKIGVKWVSLLWLEKGHFIPYRGIPDAGAFPRGMRSDYSVAESVHANWSKSRQVFEWRFNAFSQANGIVFDPFTGGGTVPAVCKLLGRQYLAFEIDPAIAEFARQRVRNTQPPLFVTQPEQAELVL